MSRLTLCLVALLLGAAPAVWAGESPPPPPCRPVSCRAAAASHSLPSEPPTPGPSPLTGAGRALTEEMGQEVSWAWLFARPRSLRCKALATPCRPGAPASHSLRHSLPLQMMAPALSGDMMAPAPAPGK